MHKGHVAALPCTRSRRKFQLQCWMWERCHWHGVFIYIYIHIIYSFCFERTQYLRLETSVRNQCALKLARTVCHSKFACRQCLHFSPFLIRSMLAACYRLAGQGKRDFPIIGRSSFSYSSEVLWLQSLRCTRNRQIPERDVKSAENVSC